jgi:hypothetical protein
VSNAASTIAARQKIDPSGREQMADNGKKNEPAKKAEDKSKKPLPPPDEEDEDGDIATPKRDRDGTDDEPL